MAAEESLHKSLQQVREPCCELWEHQHNTVVFKIASKTVCVVGASHEAEQSQFCMHAYWMLLCLPAPIPNMPFVSGKLQSNARCYIHALKQLNLPICTMVYVYSSSGHYRLHNPALTHLDVNKAVLERLM